MESLSITQVTNYIKSLIDKDEILNGVSVCGEVSNYKVYPSGHHYFTLKDSGAALKCVMFKTAADKLSFRPSDGQKLIAHGRISVFPRDGAYQMYCEALVQDGAGSLAAAYEALFAKLSEEGLFDKRHKKPLPKYPARVALVTSPAGAVVRDMVRIFKRRWPLCTILIAPVRVQGEEAPKEIVSALRYLNKENLADLIITGRGGGSIEDLWAFNDERVARAIFASIIPVISAVGHEPDVTIADYVADVRASTPSHAAEIAAPDIDEIRMRIAQLRDRLPVLLESGVNIKRNFLQTSKHGLVRALSIPVERSTQKLALTRGRMEALNPQKVLARGYSIAMSHDGKVVTSYKNIKHGERITLRLSEGRIITNVESAENG